MFKNRIYLILGLLEILLFSYNIRATTYIVNSANEINNRITQLNAGDSLLITNGEYDIGAIWLQNRHGSEQDWIVIKGLEGIPKLIGSKYENVINIDNCSYMKFEQLEITIDGTYQGIDGFTFRSSSHHIEFVKCRIINITNVGINSQVPEIHHIAVRECEIAYCSEVGIYWGYPDPLKVARDCIIENSYIHHCPTDSTQETGYGIQIKGGSYRNIVRDNVLHTVGGTTRAGIGLYYTNLSGGMSVEDNNIISGNIVWNVPAEGIYAAAGVTIENNIVYDAVWGIEIYPYTGSTTENVILQNNTVYNCRDEGIFISGWGAAGNDCIVINNVAVMDDVNKMALIAKSRGNAIFANNYYFGGMTGFDQAAKPCNPADMEFIKAGGNLSIPGLDLYPKNNSTLINSGTRAFGYPEYDFNREKRKISDSIDVGAYEFSTSENPGWQLSKGFKILDIETKLNHGNLNQPVKSHLFKNYPNPFNSETWLLFQIPERSHVNLTVSNLLGQRVATLINAELPAGEFEMNFDASELPTGIYFAHLKSESKNGNSVDISRRLVYLK